MARVTFLPSGVVAPATAGESLFDLQGHPVAEQALGGALRLEAGEERTLETEIAVAALLAAPG